MNFLLPSSTSSYMSSCEKWDQASQRVTEREKETMWEWERRTLTNSIKIYIENWYIEGISPMYILLSPAFNCEYYRVKGEQIE